MTTFESRTHRARRILTSFLFTFITARLTVFLIPDLYLHLGGTHVHHFNIGIAILSVVGAYLLLGRPGEREWLRAAAFYGIGLALTFDEFEMWLHLGGSYWQRGSFEAVLAIAACLYLPARGKRSST